MVHACHSNLNTDRDPELGCLPFKVRSQLLTEDRESVMGHSKVLFPEISTMNASYNLTPPFLASVLATYPRAYSCSGPQ